MVEVQGTLVFEYKLSSMVLDLPFDRVIWGIEHLMFIKHRIRIIVTDSAQGFASLSEGKVNV